MMLKRLPATTGAAFLLLWCSAVSAKDPNDHAGVHFAASALLGAGVETVVHFRSDVPSGGHVLLSTAIGSVPGLIKELADDREKNNEFSTRDFGADVAGALTGALVSHYFYSAVSVAVQPEHGAVRVSFATRF